MSSSKVNTQVVPRQTVRERGRSKNLRVTHYPCDDKNPYNRLLVEALSQAGVDARMVVPDAPRRNPWLDLSWATSEPIVHWHWLNRYYQGRSIPTFMVRSLLFTVSMLIIHLSGTKMVMTVHNLVPHDCRYPSLHRFMNRICGALMDRLIVHTQEAVDVVAETYGARAKIRHVNHVGYNKTQVDPVSIAELRESLGCDPSRKIFLSFGTVRPYKRIERIIAAAELFDRFGIDLVIAGKPSSGQYGSQIEKLASSKTNVRLLLGFVPDQLLSVYLAAAEAVVFGHTGTLTSGAAHMALAYGKAILCSDTVAFREMIRLGLAFPCDFEDLESLKSAVEVILTLDKDCFAQACGAYQRRCGPESVGPQLRAIYEQLLPEEAPVEQRQEARTSSPRLGNLKSTRSRTVDCDLTNR